MLRICIASKKAGVSHVVNISSLSALHNKKSPYYSIYALTKRNGDELAELYCSSNKIPLTILRPSQVYGNDIGFAAHQPFFYQVVDKAERGEDIAVYGKNDALRNYIHVSDLSETIHQVIAQSIEGTYACLYPTNIRFSAIARTAQKVFNKGGEVIFLEGKPDTPDNVFDLDTSVYEKTGHPPQVTLEEGIQGIKAYREGIQR
jgi:nucleoside-diphosphate-sugar epimerase